MLKSEEQTGKCLVKLYRKGQGSIGKYVITRKKLAEVAGRERLYDSYLNKVKKILSNMGYMFFPIPKSKGLKFVVVRESHIDQWRNIDA